MTERNRQRLAPEAVPTAGSGTRPGSPRMTHRAVLARPRQMPWTCARPGARPRSRALIPRRRRASIVSTYSGAYCLAAFRLNDSWRESHSILVPVTSLFVTLFSIRTCLPCAFMYSSPDQSRLFWLWATAAEISAVGYSALHVLSNSIAF
jgi:hypothetical protein